MNGKLVMAGLVVLLMICAVPGLGQTVTVSDLNQVTQGFQTDMAKVVSAVKDLRAGQIAQNDSIESLCEEPVETVIIEPTEPEQGVHVDAADEESVVNVVASNASDLVKVRASKGSRVSVVIGGTGTSQTTETGSSATTNDEYLPTAKPVSEMQEEAGQESNSYGPAQLQGQVQGQSLEGYNPSLAGASAGIVFTPSINVSANYGTSVPVPVVDATTGLQNNAPNREFWSGLGVEVQYLQHPQTVEILSRGSLGLVSYPISSEVKENIAYDEIHLGDGGSQIAVPTADGNVAVFSNGWIVFDNPSTALSAISAGRLVSRIERHT